MPRIVELVLAGFALVLLSLPSILVAGVVWATLGRPLLFFQTRVGQGGEYFQIYKFRTMSNARAEDGSLLPDEKREKAATRLLRRLRLDETPQLLAVLTGNLSLVGPRPLLPDTIREFGLCGEIRCRVRPGLTGWAQISGNTRLTDTEKLALDLWYVAHRSFALDLRILLETALVLLGGERRREDRLDEALPWLGRCGFDIANSISRGQGKSSRTRA